MSGLQYTGINRRGVAVTGVLVGRMTPAEFAEQQFKARWLKLRITRDDEVVGEIRPDLDGHRTWWAEK